MTVDTCSSVLKKLEDKGLRRKLRTSPDKSVLNYSSNDYLDLSGHAGLREAARKATAAYGCSVSGSRLMTGNTALHEELEQRIAELCGTESSLVFGSGFLANIGLISAIAGRNDIIFSDRLNHASLVDGALNSRAAVLRYRHCDTGHLKHLLETRSCSGRRFIITDSLFSMDGDLAPLRELDRAARKHDCLLVADEAHAVGVFGEGAGVCREKSVSPYALVGTLSKSLGGYGGFVAGSMELREFLINFSRSFIYSTGLPPSCLGSGLAAMRIVKRDTGIGNRLLSRAAYFRKLLNERGFDTSPSQSQIVPVHTGGSRKALLLSNALEKRGVLAIAIRPPTVPQNTARLRMSVTLAHTRSDLERTADALFQAASEIRL